MIANTAVHLGDCRDVLRGLPDASIDAIVTDPPYELGFMGRTWDSSGVAYDTTVWAECLRVLKPGGHLLTFGGTRTWHRLVVAVEDAGFEIRDSITWLYASGFPKSLDVSKAIDKAAGAEREVIGESPFASRKPNGSAGVASVGLSSEPGSVITAPATEAAQQWQGWGTALKPASEPVVVARKPLAGTVASNVLAYRTGALNIDGCRVPGEGGGTHCSNRDEVGRCRGHANAGRSTSGETVHGPETSAGRWPANVVLTHAPECGPADAAPCVDGCPVAELDAQSGAKPTRHNTGENGASRFFPTFRYQAKAPSHERPSYIDRGGRKIAHPTVKPLGLMRWLVRLVTPPGGTVLDPFAGSGATIEAAILEGFDVVGCELEPAHLPLIDQRIDRARRRENAQ